MINGYDIAYTAAIAVTSPVWMARHNPRHKVLSALSQRMGHSLPREDDHRAILIHAVSLGEMNATRELVNQLQHNRPDLHVIITTTTTTGFDRGRQLYANKPRVTLTRFPLDFSFAINTLLNAMRPALIVLMEGEIWPNFLLQCQRRNIPVVLVNGRISDSAFARYRRIKFITAKMLGRIATIAVQDQIYADRFVALGAGANQIKITGTMKFDTARLADSVAGDEQIAAELGLDQGPVWVCGSTGPGEEMLLLDAYRSLLEKTPALRLVIVPRKPERFDEVAGLIQASGFNLTRRSVKKPPIPQSVILVDTMGELRKFYSLATVVFVGRSLIDQGSRQWGSDMIEPAALAKPVVVGPWTHNFAQAMRSFKAVDAIVEVSTLPELIHTLTHWLEQPTVAVETGRRAQQVVLQNQGATARHVDLMLQYFSPKLK